MPEVAAVFARPHVEREHLRVAQPGPDRLARLQVLVRHRAERSEPQLLRELDVARADELGPDARGQRAQHLLVPGAREAPARAVVGDPEFGIGDGVDPARPSRRAAAALRRDPDAGMHIAIVDLRHDREHRHLEQDRVQPGPADRDVDLAVRSGDALDADEALVELEETEEVDEIALEEAPCRAGTRARRRRTAARRAAGSRRGSRRRTASDRRPDCGT